MIPLTQAITGALFQFVWQGAVVAMVLWMILFLLRRSRPEARYAAACAALFALAFLPVATAWQLYRPGLPTGPVPAVMQGFYGSANALPEPVMVAEPASQQSIYEWAFSAWLLGVSFLGLRFVWSAGRLTVLRRSGATADEETARFVTRVAERMNVRRFRVLFSPLTDVPGVIGWVRPVILLPAATLVGLTPAQLEAVIAHELAHIRRHDYAVNILQMVVEILLFYHPAVWWTSKRMRVERELCCDDLAVRTCGDRLGYARALAAIEKRRVLKPDLAVGSGDGPLLFRIKRLVSPDVHQPAPSRLAGAVVLLSMISLLLASNVHGLRAQDVLPEPPTEVKALPVQTAPPLLSGVFLQQDSARAALEPQATTQQPNAPTAPTQAPQLAQQQQNGLDAWLLIFNGRSFSNRVSPAQAEELRRTFAGGFLWFRLGGTAYVTQDRAVLEQMAARYAPSVNSQSLPQNERELAAYLNQLAERRDRHASLARQIAQLQLEMTRAEELSGRGLLSQQDTSRVRAQYAALVAEMRALELARVESESLNREPRQRERAAAGAPPTNADAALQDRLMELQAQIMELQANINQKLKEQSTLQEHLQAVRALAEKLNKLRQDVEQVEQTTEILREAIESGTAKPVP